MLNIDVLTVGSEFKNNTGETYKVTSNFSEGDKVFAELEKEKVAEVEPEEELLEESK